MDKIVFVAFNCGEKILPPFLLCDLKYYPSHRAIFGGTSLFEAFPPPGKRKKM